MDASWEVGIVEWLWDVNRIQYFLPDGQHGDQPGSYAEVVAVLSELGRAGWQVVGNTSSANWVFWTLQRVALG